MPTLTSSSHTLSNVNGSIRSHRTLAFAILAFLGVLVLTAGRTRKVSAAEPPISETLSNILETQVAAWNRGDLDQFMQYYWQSERLTFSSGGKVTRGWKTTKANYQKRYPDRAAMGRVKFDQLEFQPLGDTAYLVLGRWQLQRELEPVQGNFSLVFRKIDGAWKIIHDHTSRLAE